MIQIGRDFIARPAHGSVGLGKDNRVRRNGIGICRGVEAAGVEFPGMFVIILADTDDIAARRRDRGDELCALIGDPRFFLVCCQRFGGGGQRLVTAFYKGGHVGGQPGGSDGKIDDFRAVFGNCADANLAAASEGYEFHDCLGFGFCFSV